MNTNKPKSKSISRWKKHLLGKMLSTRSTLLIISLMNRIIEMKRKSFSKLLRTLPKKALKTE